MTNRRFLFRFYAMAVIGACLVAAVSFVVTAVIYDLIKTPDAEAGTWFPNLGNTLIALALSLGLGAIENAATNANDEKRREQAVTDWNGLDQ